jgi:hypothetical protein
MTALLRGALCWLMVAIVPTSLLAADLGAAMLYANGTAWLNGSTVPRSSAIFPGDLVQTKPDAVANINAWGSSVIILPDSLVKFEGSAISVQHGGVSVGTSKRIVARAGEVTVTPASNAWTVFEVADANGTVQIVARQGEVSVSDGSETTTLAQGQQTTRDDSQDGKKKTKRRGGGAVPAGRAAIMDSPIAIALGAGGTAALVTWVLLQDDDPLSPSRPVP